ncbi:MAG: type 3 dihydrofolate reductase [Bacteroidales bacterium]
MKPKISIIAATGKNNVIGKDNTMPWHMPADLRFFKKTTYGHPVIMGRKTFESLGKPLPGRKNIILSRNITLKDKFDNAIIVNSFSKALKAAEQAEEVFVAGGSEIYQLALPFTDRIYLTKIDVEVEGDAFFPEINEEEWMTTQKEQHKANPENPFDYEFIILDRVS